MNDKKKLKMQAQGRPDDFQTPADALIPLYPYLQKEWVVWESACGKGRIKDALEAEGFSVIATDILGGYDFLTWKPDGFDCIITNPPYSIRDDFLARCYTLGKPFALLMPLTSLEGIRRQRLYREYGVEVIVMPRRINFETPSGIGSGAWFATAWFTRWMGVAKSLLFYCADEKAIYPEGGLFNASNHT